MRNQNVHFIKRQSGRYIQGGNVILINSSLQANTGFLVNNYTLLAMEKVGGLNDSLWTLLLKDKLIRGESLRSWLEGKNTCHSCKRRRFHSQTYMLASDSVSGLLDNLFWELCTEYIYITDKCTHKINYYFLSFNNILIQSNKWTFLLRWAISILPKMILSHGL